MRPQPELARVEISGTGRADKSKDSFSASLQALPTPPLGLSVPIPASQQGKQLVWSGRLTTAAAERPGGPSPLQPTALRVPHSCPRPGPHGGRSTPPHRARPACFTLKPAWPKNPARTQTSSCLHWLLLGGSRDLTSLPRQIFPIQVAPPT